MFSLFSDRLFAAKCAKCSTSFNKDDLVMKARNKIYHTNCFSCVRCSKQLVSGEEFALQDDLLYCKSCTPPSFSHWSKSPPHTDYEVLDTKGHFLQELSPVAGSSISPLSNSNSSSNTSANGSTGRGSKLRLSGKKSRTGQGKATPCEGCRLCLHNCIL